jgi:hypothetical protein
MALPAVQDTGMAQNSCEPKRCAELSETASPCAWMHAHVMPNGAMTPFRCTSNKAYSLGALGW